MQGMRGSISFQHTILSVLFLSTAILPVRGSITAEKNDSTGTNITELRKLYAINKTIPADLEKEILVSLSHYPELSNVRIKFTYGSIFTSMKAVPTLGFLFKKRENRVYRIVMNKKQCASGTNLMQRAPSSALTGVLGHELGHIKDYSRLSNFGLIKFMVSYVFKKGRVEAEKRADRFAVEHNLGEQLLEFNNYIMNDACMDPKYIRYKKKFYNSSDTLGEMVNSHETLTSF
jgi:hypothetical protein